MIRKIILQSLIFLYSPYVECLYRRAFYLEVGTVGGKVSLDDELQAKFVFKLKPLDGFEKWLLDDWIRGSKREHRKAHQVVTCKSKERC